MSPKIIQSETPISKIQENQTKYKYHPQICMEKGLPHYFTISTNKY
jgi:hypothetical protein